MEAFTFHFVSGSFTLGRQCCHGAAHLGHSLTGSFTIGSGVGQLAPRLRCRGFLTFSTCQLRISAAFRGCGTPTCVNSYPFLCPGPLGCGITFLLNLIQSYTGSLYLGP